MTFENVKMFGCKFMKAFLHKKLKDVMKKYFKST